MDIKKELELFIKENLEVPYIARHASFDYIQEDFLEEEAFVEPIIEKQPIKKKFFSLDKLSKQSIPVSEKKVDKNTFPSPNIFGGSIKEIDNYISTEQTENKFQKLLFEYIDRNNLKDSDVYKKVNIDRRLFSKIRNDTDYHPKKETIILLAISLKLNEDELLDLLNSASYTLPKNNISDLIIRFCFQKQIYDLDTVNNLLYEHDCKTLN